MENVRTYREGGRVRYYCIGKNNSCDATARSKGGKCGSCAGGRGRIAAENRVIGEIWLENDYRYRMTESGRERLCNYNDTCMTRACSGDTCKLHRAGGEAYRGRNSGVINVGNGKEIRPNGLAYRRKTPADQFRHVCLYGDCITGVAGLTTIYCEDHAAIVSKSGDPGHAEVIEDIVENADHETMNDEIIDQPIHMIEDTVNDISAVNAYSNDVEPTAIPDTDDTIDDDPDEVSERIRAKMAAAAVEPEVQPVTRQRPRVACAVGFVRRPRPTNAEQQQEVPQRKPIISAVAKPNKIVFPKSPTNIVQKPTVIISTTAVSATDVSPAAHLPLTTSKALSVPCVTVNPNRDQYDRISAIEGRVLRKKKEPYPQWAYLRIYTDIDYVDRVVGEVFTNSKGERRMVAPARGGRRFTLSLNVICNGQDGNCTADAKKGGKCFTCLNEDGVGARRRQLANNTEGNIVTCKDGTRYRMMSGINRQLCSGDENTCLNSLKENGLCQAHINGSIPQLKGAKEGDLYIRGGYRARHNGHQFVKMCAYDEEECFVAVTKDGLCKKHSPHWRCHYEGCTKIRVDMTDYCKIHRGGVINKKEMWRMEVAVIEWCVNNGISYTDQHQVTADPSLIADGAPASAYTQRAYRFDFYLPDDRVYIETDGRQHFHQVEIWDGTEGLEKRRYIDDAKSRYAIKNGCNIIRVHYKDGRYLDAFMMRVMDQIRTNKRKTPVMYLSSSYANEERYTELSKEIECVIIIANADNKYDKIDAVDDEPADM